MDSYEEIVKEKNPHEILYIFMSVVLLSNEVGRDKKPGLVWGLWHKCEVWLY